MTAALQTRTQLRDRMRSRPRAGGDSKQTMIPWFTLAAAAGAVAAAYLPGLADALQYDRSLVAGEPWRLLTGHFTHWNADHLFWDVLMFAALAWSIEAEGRGRAIGLMPAAAGAISAYLWFAGPSQSTYRGLSGIDSALFVYAAAGRTRSARRDGDKTTALAASAALVGFCGKVCYESLTGCCLFVDTAAAGFTPLPTVHLVGAGVGLLFALAKRQTPIGTSPA